MGFLSDVGGFFTDMGEGVGDSVEGLFHDVLGRAGEPKELAAQLMQLAEQVEQLGKQLQADAAKASWQGEAADAFRQHTARLSAQFSAVSTEIRDAAGVAAELI